MKRVALASLLAGLGLAAVGLAVACGNDSPPAIGPAGGPDASLDGPNVSPYAAECAGASTPPEQIECTGLYTDLATKTVAPGIRPYAPAVPLWSDGAEKQRWIYLPPGTTIDTTNPTEWTFPVGTKVWKQFSRDGRRVETRLFQKVQASYWVRTTYAWNADETAASISAGGDIPWGTDGGTYHIPTADECDQCHRGRTDHLLGFEQVSLGLSGATGMTLSDLVAEQLLAPVPAQTSLTVGDDGTGKAAAPLEWLHINCGVSCHNDNPNSTAYGASMRLRLDPTELDGRSSASFPSRTTTIGVVATTPAWDGQTRIVPGDPAHSLLVKLISNRGTDNPVDNQMPPIATSVVDTADTQNVVAWIMAMASPAAPDAGVDAGGSDAGPSDAGDAGGTQGGSDAGTDAGDGAATPDASEAGAGSGGSDANETDGETDAADDAAE
jgi:hypothetical protein